jgi:hypothetical protein
MSEQQKRVSTPENGHGGKRPRATASPEGGVKKERRGQGQAEATQGGGVEGAVVAVEAMDEPQISVRISVARLHCSTCLVPLKPPSFKVRSLLLLIAVVDGVYWESKFRFFLGWMERVCFLSGNRAGIFCSSCWMKWVFFSGRKSRT